MFENIPSAQGNEPEDIFAKTTSTPPAMASGSLPPPQAPIAPESFVPTPEEGGGAGKIAIIVVAAVLGVGVLGALGYYVKTVVFAPKPVLNVNAPVVPVVTEVPVVNTPVIPPVTEQPAVTPTAETGILPANQTDSDSDGLNDALEAQLGTNPKAIDTDSDGLFDGEEVNIYHTDPLKADTDGDGFLDGEEVSNGYNPNGPGRMLVNPTTVTPTPPAASPTTPETTPAQ